MLGIRPDQDKFYLVNNTKRSSQFANRLNGRFFVSGISGSFQKYKRQLLEEKGEYEKPPKPPKYDYQPVLERHQRDELRRDAERLLELEEKLKEIQRIKEMKRHRDRQRRRKKLEYLSAKKIQITFRTFYERKYTTAIETVKNFLKAVAAQQAIYAANWAIGVLRRFAQHVSQKWWERRVLRKHAQRVAEENWLLVQEVACIWTAARRSVTDSFVHHVINVGRNKALLTCTQDRRKKKKKVKKDKPAPPPQDNAYLQFFLTEFDNMGPTGGGGSDDDASSYYYVDGDSDDENDSLNSPNKRKKGPMGPSPNIRQASRYAQGTTASTRTQGQSSKKKQYDPNDYKVKQLIKKHTEVMKTMEDEQTKRAALVEQAKQKAAEKAARLKQREEDEKLHKHQAKQEFLKKLEDEKQRRIVMLSKLRDEQQKKAKEQADEKDREKEELRAMYREDTLLRVLKYIQRPKTASKAAIKTPHTNAGKNVPRSFADIVTEAANITKPTEDMIAKKKAFNEEAAKKFRETLQQRIKAKKQQDLLIQKEKANEELKKREKVSSFLEAYQEQLQKKKQELLLKKKKERQERRKQKKLAKLAAQQQQQDDEEEESEEEEDEDKEQKETVYEDTAADYENHGEKIEDFQFEEFLQKSISIYDKTDAEDDQVDVDQPVDNEGTNPLQLFPGEEPMEGLEDVLLPPPPVAGKEFDHSAAKPAAKEATKKIEKIPKALQNTPYFAAYLKHVTNPTGDPNVVFAPAPKVANKTPKNNDKGGFFVDTAITANSGLRKEARSSNNMPSYHPKKGAKSSTNANDAFSKFDINNVENSMEQVDELMAIVQRAKQKLLETPSNLPFQMPVANFSEPPPVQEPISLPKEIEQPVVIAPLDIPAVNFSGKLNSKPTSTTPMPSMPSMNYMLSNNALLGKGPPTLPTMPDAVSSICNRHNIGLADIGMAPKAPIKKMTKKKAEAPLPISKPTVPVLPTKKPVAQIKSLSKEPTPKVPPAIKGSKSQPVLGKPNSSNNGEGDNLMKVSIPTTVKNLRYSGSTSAIVSHEKENESFETASRPMTGDSHDSADGSRPNSNGSNRIRGKITQYQDYEDKLQQDYLQLKEKFNQKLQLQVQQSQKGGSNNQAVIDDDPMRKSLTEHYANASESIAMNENKKNFVPPEPTRISTRDLLMEWAMEDALEEAQQREGDASGGDENQEEEEYYNEEGEEEGEGEDEEEFEEEEQEEEEEQYPRQLYQKSAQSASQLAAHQEEEEEEQYDEDDVEEEEEEDEDDDYYQDHRQSMRQQWNQLLVANEHPDHADESCLQLLHNLSTKMKTTI